MILNINGNDVSPYAIGVHREESVCQIGSTLEIRLSPSLPTIPECGNAVFFSALGATFSGWITDVDIDATEKMITVVAGDCCPINDHFITDELVGNYEDVAYWINYFLDSVNMKAEDLPNTGKVVPPTFNFQFRRLPDVLMALLTAMGEYTIVSDGNFRAVVRPMMAHEFTDVGDVVGLKTTLALNWIRNEVIVIWSENDEQRVTSGSMANEYLDKEGLKQRLIIAHPYIRWQSVAEDFLERALSVFSQPLFVKDVSCSSGSVPQLRYRAQAGGYSGYISGVRSYYFNDHVESHVEIDGRCHILWEWPLLGAIDIAKAVIEVDTEGAPRIAKAVVEVDADGNIMIDYLFINWEYGW